MLPQEETASGYLIPFVLHEGRPQKKESKTIRREVEHACV